MKKKNKFANAIVIICIAMSIIISACVIYEYHRLDETIPSSVLAIITSQFTGELLILALRQIFGTDVTKKDKSKSEESI